jgi:hypothetical protein
MEFAKVRIENMDDTVPPEFTILSTLESMRDRFNGEDLRQGRPTTRVSDVLTYKYNGCSFKPIFKSNRR